jgi:hypothetical protein
MPARQCPDCSAILPAAKVASRSNDLACEGCGRPLEIAPFSRYLSAFVGLAAAALTFRVASSQYAAHSPALGWLFPVVFAYLAFSFFSAFVMLFAADLRVRAVEEPPAPHEAAHHGPHHAPHHAHH